MLNRIILIGRLTRDPEMKYLANGTPVANFSLAVDRPFTNQQGNREADFIDCVAWRKLGETVANHLTKGRLVATRSHSEVDRPDPELGRDSRQLVVYFDDRVTSPLDKQA